VNSKREENVPAQTKIFLYGSLRAEIAPESGMECPLEHSLSVRDLLDRIPVSAERVQLVMVNHRAVPSEHVVNPGDRVALFPREYMIFADWKNYRS
jgi:molybdopterin converting factor small subunit